MGITYYEFDIDGCPDDLYVARFEGVERMCGMYEIVVTSVCKNPELPFDPIVGSPALLKMTSAERDWPRLLHGIVCEFEEGAEGKANTIYRAKVVPEVWKASRKQDFRIFQEKTTPDIITEVFNSNGFKVCTLDSRLSRSYRTHEYRVQYRESDWAFMLRLMEEEGIFCFWEYSETGHVLVLGDSLSAHPPIPGEVRIPYREPSGMNSEEHIWRFRLRQGVEPGKVTLRDYNFKKPALDLEKDATGSKDTTIEVYDYPGEYSEPDEGANLAQLRLERWEAHRRTARGESGCMRLVPGHTFQFYDYIRQDADRGYLVTEVVHDAKQAAGRHSNIQARYNNEYSLILDDVLYRPFEKTPKPKIQGVQTAIVVGPPGEEIYPDEHGRVKVQFHWDREGNNDEHSSCWIRVSQVWAGAGWGAMQIPRIGQEVIVDFLEGDPDRPLIVGRVYHGTNVPPYRLPAEKTISTIRSETSPGGNGYNELRFEDAANKEEIFLHGQKDWTIQIEHDKRQEIGRDEALEVGRDRTREIGRNQKEKIGRNKTITVMGQHKERIALTESITVGLMSTHKVGGALRETVGAAKTSRVLGLYNQKVGRSMTLKVGKNMKNTVGKELSASIGSDAEISIGGKHQLSVDKAQVIRIGEDASERVEKVKSTNVGEKYSLVVGDGTLTIKKNGDIVLEGKKIRIEGSAPIEIEGQKLRLKSKSTIDVKAKGAIKMKGSKVGLN